MKTELKKRFYAPLVLCLAGILTAQCGSGENLYPFYIFELDKDSGAGPDGDTDTSTYQTDTDTDTCEDDYVEGIGKCIRYVNQNSDYEECGHHWRDAFTTVQDGIASAVAAVSILGYCEVWVAKGTYKSFVDSREDTIELPLGVAVFGGFSGDENERDQRNFTENETVLEGAASDGSNGSYHVVTGAGGGILDGFTVRGGVADGELPHNRGGGIYINSSSTQIRNCIVTQNAAKDGGAVWAWASSPVITNTLIIENTAEKGGGLYLMNGFMSLQAVVITQNTASQNGGGIYLEKNSGACSPLFSDSVISYNEAYLDGGGVYNRECDPSIENSLIQSNTALLDGGGIAAFRGTTTIENTTIADNWAGENGGGVSSEYNQTLLDTCLITGNMADNDGGGSALSWADGNYMSCTVTGNSASGNGGGFYFEWDFTEITNTLVDGNKSWRGGGSYSGSRGDPDFTNSVLVGNVALDLGGGLYNADLSEVDVVNSVIWSNGLSPVFDEPGSTTTITYSDVEGGYVGLGNIDAEPYFETQGYWNDQGTPLDPTDDSWVVGDYHLTVGSPCIDSADDTALPVTDADGLIWEDIPDAGTPGTLGDMGSFDYKP